MTGVSSVLERRALAHRALGDAHRLAIVDALRLSDRGAGELRTLLGLPWSLLAFHLDALEDAGLVERRRSAGDGRRRYVRLVPEALGALLPPPRLRAGRALFVCTRNSARSQFAAALWRARSGRPCASAGSDPAPAVHPLAVAVARDRGLDLSGCHPIGYLEVGLVPDLVVTVCDRALEGGLPFPGARLHWSVDDPVDGGRAAFEAAFDDVERRVTALVEAA